MNVRDLLPDVAARLTSDTPELDSQVILAHVMSRPRTWLLAHAETPLSAPQLAAVDAAVSRLEAGTPLPYVIGHWEFFGLDFDLTPDVLIPRPETEMLVGRALAWLRANPARRMIADVGTGSGAIGVSLAVQIPDARVIATDVSLPALHVARRNAARFDLGPRMEFVQCDLLPAHHDSIATGLHFDLICANLPYIPTQTLRGLEVFGREPSLALNGGKHGLDLIRRLLGTAGAWLAPHGLILLEIEASQGLAVLSLAYDEYSQAEIHLHQDLSGRDRLVEIAL